MKKIIFIILIIIAIGLGVVANFLGLFSQEENIKTAKKTPQISAFKPVDLNFTHIVDKSSFPFTGGTSIDINGDGTMELFLSGSKGQSNGLFEYKNNELVDITENSNLSLTDKSVFGATSFDIDNDGDTDLVLAQNDGVWIYTNNEGQFTGKNVPFNAPKNSFPVNVTIADINNDNLPDFYVSNFADLSQFVAATFNDPNHAKANTMLLNKGNGKFEDITEKTGTAGSQNTFTSVFVDLDNNGHQDLLLSNNTGRVEMFKNMGNLNFEPFNVNSGLGYWMGIGLGDIDKDGDQDIFFSNIGTSIKETLVRGDLRDDQAINLEWLILRNNGDWSFDNITKDYQLDGYGFAWGGVFEDINLDGDLDFLVGQNYINWPGHNIDKLPNKAFLQIEQDGKKGFYHLDELGLNNPYYGQSPLIIDLNNDNKPDVVWLNMNGPAKAFLNTSDNNSFKVIVPENITHLGSKVTLTTNKGKSYTKVVMTNVGMASDQTPNLFFGLGKDDVVKHIDVIKINGDTTTIDWSNSSENTVELP